VPASGGTVQQWSETRTMVLGFDWLPDGSGLVAAIKGWQGQDDNRLYRVPLPGFADRDATLYLDHPLATAADYPRFSPDGRLLAFRSAYGAILSIPRPARSWRSPARAFTTARCLESRGVRRGKRCQ
jgi:Tol biopolymer transport system component